MNQTGCCWIRCCLAACLSLAACVRAASSDGAGGTPGGGTGGNAVGGTGGTGGTNPPGTGGRATGGGSGGGPANSNPTLLCPPTGSTCTQAVWNAYSTCVADACDAQYRSCLGPSYRSGVFAGPCQPWAQCLAGCGCGNPGCTAACPAQTSECATCYATASSCLLSCALPSCAFTTTDAGTGGARDGATGDVAGGDGGAGVNCAAFLACCRAMPDPAQQMDCTDVYGSISGVGDRACGQILDEYRMLGFCP